MIRDCGLEKWRGRGRGGVGCRLAGWPGLAWPGLAWGVMNEVMNEAMVRKYYVYLLRRLSWLAGWEVGWLAHWPGVWQAGWRFGKFTGWPVVCLSGWLAGLVAGRPACRLAGWLAGWLEVDARCCRLRDKVAVLGASFKRSTQKCFKNWATSVFLAKVSEAHP